PLALREAIGFEEPMALLPPARQRYRYCRARSTQKYREAAFENLYPTAAQAATLFADDTTLKRVTGEEHFPYVFLQASLACSPSEAVVAILRTRCGANTMKWGLVASFVSSRVSEDAARVRRRLEEATIMVVDPAAFLRSHDLIADRRTALPPT